MLLRTNAKLVVLLLFLSSYLTGQSPYEFDKKKEIYYLGVGVSTFLSGWIVENDNFPIYSSEEISGLNRNSINFFDRKATYNFSSSAKKSSDYCKLFAVSAPLLFLSNSTTRKDFLKIAGLYGETLLVTGGITYLTKRLVKRPRPLVYNELVPLSEKQNKNSRYSFFSGHTSISAASSFFTASVFSEYFPESKWKIMVWGTSILIPAATGYFRVQAGKHYPSDVISGYAVGAFIGFLVPKLHKKINKKNHLSITPLPAGFALEYKF